MQLGQQHLPSRTNNCSWVQVIALVLAHSHVLASCILLQAEAIRALLYCLC